MNKGHPDNLGRVLAHERPGGAMPTEFLADLEQNVLRRMGPRRSRWPDLVAIDERVAELDRRLADVGPRLADLRAQLASAPRADADARAEWELSDRKGARPEPTVERIEREIADAELEVDGLERAAGQVLAEKATYVAKHRKRLVRDADAETQRAHENVLRLVDELEQARAALVALRSTAVWASLYPGPEAARGPRENVVAGGLAKPVRDTLGIDVQVEHERLLRAIRADADFWRSAATAEQRIAMGDAPEPGHGAATWAQTPEGVEAERAERQAARDRYAQMWGEAPGEWSA